MCACGGGGSPGTQCLIQALETAKITEAQLRDKYTRLKHAVVKAGLHQMTSSYVKMCDVGSHLFGAMNDVTAMMPVRCLPPIDASYADLPCCRAGWGVRRRWERGAGVRVPVCRGSCSSPASPTWLSSTLAATVACFVRCFAGVTQPPCNDSPCMTRLCTATLCVRCVV